MKWACRSLLAAYGFAVIGMVVFAVWLRWEAVIMAVAVSKLASLLSPIVFASAVVERGVEILISPWRDIGANQLEAELALIKAQPTSEAQKTQLIGKSKDLSEYRGKTQQYAFAMSLILSLVVSISGIRAFEPFLDTAKFDELASRQPNQHIFFLCMDVLVSAILLAGGADGIHSVVNAVTSFFDASAEKTSHTTPPA